MESFIDCTFVDLCVGFCLILTFVLIVSYGGAAILQKLDEIKECKKTWYILKPCAKISWMQHSLYMKPLFNNTDSKYYTNDQIFNVKNKREGIKLIKKIRYYDIDGKKISAIKWLRKGDLFWT